MNGAIERTESVPGWIAAVSPVTWRYWTKLLDEGWLMKYLLATVSRAKDFEHKYCPMCNPKREPHPVDELNNLRGIFETLVDGRDLGLHQFLLDRHKAIESSTSKRMLEAIRVLVGSAGAAVWLSRLGQGGQGGLNHLQDWLRDLAGLLGEKVMDELNLEWKGIPFFQLEDAARKAGWVIPATMIFVRWWLGIKVSPTVEVPVAGVRVSNGEELGYISDLRLYKLDSPTPESGGKLLQHPSCALHAFASDWVEPLETVAAICNYPVCWEIEFRASPEKLRTMFSGRSAGGAVARALCLMAAGKTVDPGVLVLASVHAQPAWATSHSPEYLHLERVEEKTMHLKIEAGKKEPDIDTIIEALDSGELRVHRKRDGVWVSVG